MSLRTLAELDLGVILEGDAFGFRWAINLTDPEGFTSPDLYGISQDIAQVVDPDTGELVNGRLASVSLRLSTLSSLGFTGIPKGVESATAKPWVVEFLDINGTSHTFKVRHGNPDRTLGVVNCILEGYAP